MQIKSKSTERMTQFEETSDQHTRLLDQNCHLCAMDKELCIHSHEQMSKFSGKALPDKLD